MADNTKFQNFVNAEIPKRISINQMPVTGNLPPGKILKTTGIGLNVEITDTDPLNQTLIAVYNNTAAPISLNKVLEVNGALENNDLPAIPAIKTIDNINPDIPIGILIGQLEDDLASIKMLNEDTKYPTLDPGKIGLAVRVGRLNESGLNTSESTVGNFVYCDTDGDLTLTETELRIGQVLTRGENGILYVNLGNVSSSETTAGGSLWISEISPQNSAKNAVISEYEYINDINNKKVASQGVANTYDIKVKVFAMSGSSHYKPRVTVNNVPVSLVPSTHPFEWTGEVSLTWSQETPYLVAVHEDGAKHTVAMVYETGPVIEYVRFNGYPTFNALTASGNQTFTQTEVKEADIVNVSVKLASSSTKPAYGLKIGTNTSVITEQDACKETVFDLSSNPLLPGETRTFQIRVANRGNSVQALPTKAYATTQNGSHGATVLSNVGGTIDGINLLNCNNIRVSIETLEIQYPIATIGMNTIVQKAMKQYESTTWQQRLLNLGADPLIRYEILNTNHLSFEGTDTAFDFINQGSTYEKDFYCIGSNVFNISLHNVAVHVYRKENGAYSSKTDLLKVADMSCVIKVSEETARLRADFTSEGKLAWIKITSDQPLYEAPSLSFDNDMSENPVWNGLWVKDDTDGYVWKRYLNIKSTTSKGDFTWEGLVAKNLALRETTIIYVGGTDNNVYSVGGFIKKEIQIPAWTGEVEPVSIGIDVANVNKLQCTNLSKGESGSLNCSYQSFPLGTNVFNILANLTNLDTYVNKFTMTDAAGFIVSKPTCWFNLDIKNASSNTTGEMKIEIEEII